MRIQEAASLRLDEIYRYTRDRWGIEQAERYITELFAAFGQRFEFAAQGRTVLLSSHLLGEIQVMAHDVVIINRGKLVAAGSVQELEAMREGAAQFVGEHDFAAFTANPSRVVESTVRTIHALDVVQDGPLVELRVSGNGFLYKMVRSIAGFLIAVGVGKEKPAAVTEVMDSRVRTARVESAPPQGLTLWRVWYS